MTKTQESNTSNPMATGNIPKLLAQLAIPAVIAQIINLLYNIVDRIYIGHIRSTYRSWTFYSDPDASQCLCDAGRFRRSTTCSDRNGKK